MAEDVHGLSELIARLNTVPRRLADRTLSGWATATANRMAARLRPVVRAGAFKTGRMLGAIRGARVRPQKARALFQSIARAITFGSARHGGQAWGIINSGTAPRWTKGTIKRDKRGRYLTRQQSRSILGKKAYRGKGPRLAIAERAGPFILMLVLPSAKEDLARRVQRVLSKNGGGA